MLAFSYSASEEANRLPDLPMRALPPRPWMMGHVLGAIVLVIAGPPCAGKSTLGRLVAQRMHGQPAPFVQVDRVFDLLLPFSDRGRSDRMLGYEASHALVRTLLDNDRDCVLECTYARRDQRASLRSALAGLCASPLRVVEIRVSVEEALARFQQRSDVTDLDESSLRERVVNYPFWNGALQLEAGSAAPEEMARRVVDWLGRSPDAVDWDEWTQAGRDWT